MRHGLIGWMLFVICALFFILSSLRNRDLFALAGSIIFLAACVVFLLPLVRSKSGTGPDDSR
jgi:hypothetical protein